MLQTFLPGEWEESNALLQQQALKDLESGHLLFFPKMEFTILPEERFLLSPAHADPSAKNISYHPKQHKLWGVQRLTDRERIQLKSMLDRFFVYAFGLIQKVLPHYSQELIIARTSFRPVQISGRKTSYRKDDKRLHVDAFPSAPNQGKRILRVFCNINPNGEERLWHIGEAFEQVASRFLPKITKPFPGKSALLRLSRVTKSYRTLYDHYMLRMHDLMKADEAYQKCAPKEEIRFPSGSMWIVQTDHVSHAAINGQYALEQTFYLPVSAMEDPSKSPLKILEEMLHLRLV